MRWALSLITAGAALQLALPVQAARPVMVALCSGGAPIPLPMKHRDSDQPCCKVCHSARRGRVGGDTCCSKDGGEEEE